MALSADGLILEELKAIRELLSDLKYLTVPTIDPIPTPTPTPIKQDTKTTDRAFSPRHKCFINTCPLCNTITRCKCNTGDNKRINTNNNCKGSCK